MSDNRTSELLPCPFCGGEAFVNDDPTGNGGKPHMNGNVGIGRLWSVECDECGADAGFWQDRNVAIAAWNTRVKRTCRDASVDSSTQFYCSLCECTVDVPLLWGEINYCPNCGAKVRNE